MGKKIILLLGLISIFMLFKPVKVYAADDVASNSSFICKEEMKDSDGEYTLRGLINRYWSWVAFLCPLGLIGLISFDFVKAVTSSDADSIKKAASNTLKRVIAALLLLLTPLITQTIFGFFGLTFCF